MMRSFEEQEDGCICCAGARPAENIDANGVVVVARRKGFSVTSEYRLPAEHEGEISRLQYSISGTIR